MKNLIIKGDFPEGSNIDFTNYFSKEDIGISWVEGWKTKSLTLLLFLCYLSIKSNIIFSTASRLKILVL